jgi:peptide-methionine (S)-S-oxide reductase
MHPEGAVTEGRSKMRLRPVALAAALAAVTLAALALLAGQRAARAAGTEVPSPAPGLSRATFAGGCFWCMEPPFEKLPGVVDVISGYTGGPLRNPTYEQVSSGGTGHLEAVQVVYDRSRVSYETLLDVFWRNVDPTMPNRQFCDVGEQYGTAIFHHDDEQKKLALESKARIERTRRFAEAVVTPVRPAVAFYRAEEYHQDYYRKNPIRYRFYRYNCGRDQRLKQLWGEEAGH